MSESRASRTLVKSTPELWSEVSSPVSLQRHMDQFGEIRITKLEPETAVAWEGEHARGTIRLEPSGWGTKVSLTSSLVTGEGAPDEHEQPDAPREDRAEAGLLPAGLVLPFETVETEMRELTVFLERSRREAELQKSRWPRRLARRMRLWFAPELEEGNGPPAPDDPAPLTPEPEAVASGAVSVPATPPQSEPQSPQGAALNAVLDSLGQAHRRPYSRA